MVDACGLVHGWPGIPDRRLPLDLTTLERILFPHWSWPVSWACWRFPFCSNSEMANERYGIYFLQSIFSIFAFSRLTPDVGTASNVPK